MALVTLRPDADVALDGWTDQAGGTSGISAGIDETSASDSDYVQSPPVEVGSGGGGGGIITIGSSLVSTTTWGRATRERAAQNFISIGSVVNAVRVWLRDTGTPVDTAVVKIYTVDGAHHPTTTQVGVTSNALGGTTGTPVPFDFTFTPPVPVTNGGEYALVLERTGALDSSHFYGCVYQAGTYPDGDFQNFDGTAWVTDATRDLNCVINQEGGGAATTDLTVRLFDGATQVAAWTHSDIAETFTTAEQTLTAPQLAAITDFNNLEAELDDTHGNVYRFALGNPSGAVDAPIKVRYRYKKLVA